MRTRVRAWRCSYGQPDAHVSTHVYGRIDAHLVLMWTVRRSYEQDPRHYVHFLQQSAHILRYMCTHLPTLCTSSHVSPPHHVSHHGHACHHPVGQTGQPSVGNETDMRDKSDPGVVKLGRGWVGETP